MIIGKVKRILKYKYWGLFIFPFLLVFLAGREANTRFSRDLSHFFPKESLSKKERVLYFLTEEEKNSNLSLREKKEFTHAVVRSGQRLQLPDGTKLGGHIPDSDLFLYVWAKTRSDLRSDSKPGYGILGLPEFQVANLEKKAGAKIDRVFDVFNFNLQFKIALVLYKEYLSAGLSAKDAYLKLYGLNKSSNEWERLEKIYTELHEKVIPENL
ncbi:hypothetical protein LPTSP3_g33440 [Leptospira kobayashii]|uniref:Uncharacterized protein n=1 Tax=Leptospira kobayashii TaxID=1917830 RepID=A0ABM7UN59_9LEPT|nr:hypothetical protein LPTSP3_g33440 [Leptospira kobayashii]